MQSAGYIWAKVLSHLEKQLGDIAVAAALDDADVVSMDDTTLVLFSPSDFRRQLIREKYISYIQDALAQVADFHGRIEVPEADTLTQLQADRYEERIPVIPRFTFGKFIVGPQNEIAYGAAMAVARTPAGAYNPLFLYGPPGVGKTHLLHAIANAALQNDPGAKIVFIKGDQFTVELINAIKTGKGNEFRHKYRDTDLLLVDDVHFIAGKESTQEEFFHTFNSLYESGKQIVLTSDREPGALATLEDRLRSRFTGGVMVGIASPDYDTRLAIVRAKAAELDLKLGTQVEEYLAGVLSDNVRLIEGAVRKLRAYVDISSMPLRLENVKAAISDICVNKEAAAPDPERILDICCSYFNICRETVLSKLKSKGVSYSRQMAMYLIRSHTTASFPDIARLFGRDTATVIFAVNKIGKLVEAKDTDTCRHIEELKTAISPE